MELIILSDLQFYNNPKKSYITEDGMYSWFKHQLSVAEKIFDYIKNWD